MEKQNVAPFVNKIRHTFRPRDAAIWDLFCAETGIRTDILGLQYRQACDAVAALPEAVFERGRHLIESFSIGLPERFIALEKRHNLLSNEEKRMLYFQDVLLFGTPSSTTFPRGRTTLELEKSEYLLDKRNGTIMTTAKEIVTETMATTKPPYYHAIIFARDDFFKRLLTLAQKTDSDRKPPTAEDADNRNIYAFQEFFC